MCSIFSYSKLLYAQHDGKEHKDWYSYVYRESNRVTEYVAGTSLHLRAGGIVSLLLVRNEGSCDSIYATVSIALDKGANKEDQYIPITTSLHVDSNPSIPVETMFSMKKGEKQALIMFRFPNGVGNVVQQFKSGRTSYFSFGRPMKSSMSYSLLGVSAALQRTKGTCHASERADSLGWGVPELLDYRKGCHTMSMKLAKARFKQGQAPSQIASVEDLSWHTSIYCNCMGRKVSSRWPAHEFVANEYNYSEVLFKDGTAMQCFEEALQLLETQSNH